MVKPVFLLSLSQRYGHKNPPATFIPYPLQGASLNIMGISPYIGVCVDLSAALEI